MKAVLLVLLAGLAGCSWFHRSKPPAPDPTELIVTGMPAGSTLFIDGVQSGQAAGSGRSRTVTVAPGAHTVEVKTGDAVAYRESAYVAAGQRSIVTVLSGNGRD